MPASTRSTTAYTIANEGRRLIDCDRVSVAIKQGRKCFIEAVSGQDLFDKRSNTVTLLGELATAVVATGEPVWYTGDTTRHAAAGGRSRAGVCRRVALEDSGRAAADPAASRRRRTKKSGPRWRRSAR